LIPQEESVRKLSAVCVLSFCGVGVLGSMEKFGEVNKYGEAVKS
jgi:hypothetical protein